MLYYIKLYISITTSISLVLSVCVIVIIFKCCFLIAIIWVCCWCWCWYVIVLLTSLYASLSAHKLDSSINFLNSIRLLVLYVRHASSFISTQFFILNWNGWLVFCLTNLSFFDIPLLYYYINLRSSIIFWRYISFLRYHF